VDRFGDRVLHHIAVLVPDIETAKAEMEERSAVFRKYRGAAGHARQIFTAAEVREGRFRWWNWPSGTATMVLCPSRRTV
jgi:hypothetical protein